MDAMKKDDGTKVGSPVHQLLAKTNHLTQQLGELSTSAVAVGNYDLASKALTYARGLIDASNGIVKSLEEAS
jgi:hypothetical protein